MSITFTVKNMDGHMFIRASTNQIITEKAIRQAWFTTGDDLMRTANDDILKGKKTGRIYYRKTPSGRRKKHQSSAPGESHANMTGALRKSMGWKVRGHFLHFGYGQTKPAPDYADDIETGNKFIKARPSLRNSVTKNIGKTQINISEAVKADLKR